MKNKLSKIISSMLGLTMALSILPGAALAENTTDDVKIPEIPVLAEQQMPEKRTEKPVRDRYGRPQNESMMFKRMHRTYNVENGGVPIDETTFPDANFRKYVLDNVDTITKDGRLTQDEINAVEKIECNGEGKNEDQKISNLKGIEYFTAMWGLYCSHNNLTTLDLSGNTAITNVFCNDNQLTSLDLGENNITNLDCKNNNLTALDLSKCSNLWGLFCENNQISSLDLSGKTNLTNLYCGGNQLKTLDVSQCIDPEMKERYLNLDIHSNQLCYIDLSSNTNLESLVYEEIPGKPDNIREVSYNDLLSSLETGFDAGKAKAISGGHFAEDGRIIFDAGSNEIIYEYDCGNKNVENPRFKLTRPAFAKVKEITPSGITLELENIPDMETLVYAAAYDGEGKMTAYSSKLIPGSNGKQDVVFDGAGFDKASEIKLMLSDKNFIPLSGIVPGIDKK